MPCGQQGQKRGIMAQITIAMTRRSIASEGRRRPRRAVADAEYGVRLRVKYSVFCGINSSCP